jgi:hypothetical protein
MFIERHLRMKRYLMASSYHLHLERFLKVFPQEQLWLFLLDDLRANPQQFITRVYQAIGADKDFVPHDISRIYNPAGRSRAAWLQRLLNDPGIMNRSMDLPVWMFTHLGKVRRLLVRLNRETRPNPPMSKELRQTLIKEFEETIDYVEKFLDRPLKSWRAF